MGVPVMRLYLVQVPLDGRRWYFKNPTEAKRQQKAIKPAASTCTEVSVTLTKDGVLEALNKVPFRGRGPGASAREGVSLTANTTASAPPEAAPVALRPIQVPRSRHLYQIAPEDRAKLAGKHPDYVRGWNLVKARRKF